MKIERTLEPEPLWYLKGISYVEYRQSNHWRIRRQAFLDSRSDPYHDPKCDRCHLQHLDEIVVSETYHIDVYTGARCSHRKKHAREVRTETLERRPPRFHVHHLTYEHLGEELDEDLQLLCAPCHNLIHFPESTAAQWWAKHRSLPEPSPPDLYKLTYADFLAAPIDTPIENLSPIPDNPADYDHIAAYFTEENR